VFSGGVGRRGCQKHPKRQDIDAGRKKRHLREGGRPFQGGGGAKRSEGGDQSVLRAEKKEDGKKAAPAQPPVPDECGHPLV